MAPPDTEVVVVDEALGDPQPQVEQAHLAQVLVAVGGVVVGALDHEAMQVLAGPSESDLENVVEPGQGGVGGD